MKKKYLSLIVLIVISLSFVSSAPPVTTVREFPEGYLIAEQQYHVFKFGEPLRYGFILKNATNGKSINDTHIDFCRMVTSNSQGLNTNVLNISYNETYMLWGIELNETETLNIFPTTGDYNYAVSCVNENGGELTGIFKINLSGKELEIKDIISRFSLITLFGVLIFFIYSSISKINFEKWYQKIKNKYENRNYVKMGLSAIAYQLIKNAWIIYYIIGFVIIVLLMDITYIFNIESIFSVMKIFTFIYSWSFILVGLVFLSYLQEFFKMMLEQLEDSNWGVGNEK